MMNPTKTSEIPGSVPGNMTHDDIVLPRLRLVQEKSPLSGIFPLGSIILNKETVLSDGHEPLEMTLLHIRKQFVQNLPFEARKKALAFDTPEEVRLAGGRIGKEPGRKPSFTPVLHVQLVFKAPKDFSHACPLDFSGSPYGLANWTLRGSAYYSAGRSILTAARFALKEGLAQGKWQLTTRIETVGQRTIVFPVLNNTGLHTPEFAAFLQSI